MQQNIDYPKCFAMIERDDREKNSIATHTNTQRERKGGGEKAGVKSVRRLMLETSRCNGEYNNAKDRKRKTLAERREKGEKRKRGGTLG